MYKNRFSPILVYYYISSEKGKKSFIPSIYIQHNCDYHQCWVTNRVNCVGCGPDLVQCCHCYQTCESNQSHRHLGCWRMYTNPSQNCKNLQNIVLAVINFIHIIWLQNTKLCNAKSINKSAAPGHVIIRGLKAHPQPHNFIYYLCWRQETPIIALE